MMPMTRAVIANPPKPGAESTSLAAPRQPESVLDVGPDAALGAVEHAGHRQKEQDDLGAGALALLHHRIGGPGHEGDDVVRLLLQRRLGAVAVLHGVVLQR